MLFDGMVYNNGMPIHDWSKVEAGIFHAFHTAWVSELQRALNNGLLPPDFYALAEQWTSGLGPDVLTLHGPVTEGSTENPPEGASGGVALAVKPPKVQLRRPLNEAAYYRDKARRLVVRHVSGHRIVATIEIVSPGNKSSAGALHDFLDKARAMLHSRIHLMVIDLFPPGPRDPNGLHPLIWEDDEYHPAPERALTCVSYLAAGTMGEAFIEPLGVGDVLPDMPLFLNSDYYVPVPLERTYQSAWESVPAFYRDRLTTTH